LSSDKQAPGTMAIIANTVNLADSIYSLLLSLNPPLSTNAKEKKKNTKFVLHESVWISDSHVRSNRTKR